MAIWKRKKKKHKEAKETQEVAPSEANIEEREDDTTVQDTHASSTIIESSKISSDASDESATTSVLETPTEEEKSTWNEEYIPSEETSGHETPFEPRTVLESGVILHDKKVTGFFKKVFLGLLAIFVMPPVLLFGFIVLFAVFMLIFPLLAVVLTASVPVVFITLSVLIIAFPIVFPLLVLFLLITGKGRLLVASEGRWFSLHMFGKSYSLK